MLEIYPHIVSSNYKCPACGCQLSQPQSLLFQGQHILADIKCTCCDAEYYHTFPTGHAAIFPVSFIKDGSKTKYLPKSEVWMAKPLIASMLAKDIFESEIEQIIYKASSKALILNCLDDCWGHVFHKLLNAQSHLENQTGYGLILLIPNNFKWLVPDGVAEVWAINAKMKDFRRRICNLDEFVKSQYYRFENVSLSEAHIQPDATKTNITKFTKVGRFNLDEFNKLPYTVTFIWREDRFWHGNKLEELLFLVSVKFGFLDKLKSYFCWRQMAKYNSVAKRVKKELPQSVFKLVGVGKKGILSADILDLRKESFSEETETKWCEAYAKSHIVVGVHGSNMLLPTALAAGFVEIVPNWKIDRWGEDIAQPYTDRKAFFLGRFLDGFCSPNKVSRQIMSILDGFANFIRLVS